MNNRRVLLIAYSYPPYQDPQSIRWFMFSNLLAEKGYRIDVVTIKLPNGFNKENLFSFHPNINIFRISPGPLEGFINNIRVKIGVDRRGKFSKRKVNILKILKSGYWFVMNNMLIGDLRTEWMPFCLQFLKTINLDKYFALITSQEPFVDSLIGLKMKRKKSDIFWIADMGDTVISPLRPEWKQKIDMVFEKSIVKNADMVILTNKHAMNMVSNRYNVSINKLHIITQGFSYKDIYKKEEIRNEKFTLLFTGTFYKKFREPDNLIEALKELNIDIRLIIAGKNESFVDRFEDIKDMVEFVGFIPYFESLELQRRVDVLINISNKQTYQVPGKIFEYLGSGKPILNIVYNEYDETAKLVKKLNVGLVCRNRVSDIKKSIFEFYNQWKNGKINDAFSFSSKEIYEYSWESGAEKIDRILRTVN